jgi:cytochrome c oxidase subunit 3
MRKKHLFHILPLSPWPILTAVSALFFVSGLAFYMHKVNYGGFFMLFGLMCVSTCAFQ